MQAVGQVIPSLACSAASTNSTDSCSICACRRPVLNEQQYQRNHLLIGVAKKGIDIFIHNANRDVQQIRFVRLNHRFEFAAKGAA